MSYERGMSAIKLQKPDIIPHTQYISLKELGTALTGLQPNDPKYSDAYAKKLDLDFSWWTDGPELKGRLTDMGHAIWQPDGSDYNDKFRYPFKDPEDVLSFDPVAEYGLPNVKDQAQKYNDWWKKSQKETDAVLPGGIYRSVVSFAIASFGWDAFLTAAGMDEERFGKVLDGCFKIIMAYTEAWAMTDIEVFLTHDDMVWTQGAIFHPKWYRKHVFPKFKKYWEVIKDAGKKVLFCSDGDYTEFIDDLADAGADGFIFEPLTSLEKTVEKYGKTHVIIGNADTRILTFGTKEEVRKEVKRCMDLGRDCPGYFFAVGNHIPPNVPVENAVECLNAYWEMRHR